MKAEERAESFRNKAIDILCERFPTMPVNVIQAAAEEITLLHMTEDNELIKYIGSLIGKVG